MPAPPPALAARLNRLSPHLGGRLARCGAAVRRAGREVPAGDLLWLDRLHAAGDLTDAQLAALADGRDDDLRIGPHRVRGSLGPRTLSAGGPAGPVTLKDCGPAKDEANGEHLARLAAVPPPHPSIRLPNAVIVHDGRRWAVSERTDAPTLADRLAARGRFAPDAGLNLARRLAAGLAAAEAAGVIHGEIHARNVRLSDRGPVLVDAGLAPLLPARTGDPGRGGWAETPDGPPAFGTAEDLAAFGATVWGALTGRPPFLLAARRFGTVGRDAPPLPPVADLAPDTSQVLADLLDALTGHAEPVGSFAEVADRLKPPRVKTSPVRSAAWAVACGVVGAGIVGAASAPDPGPVPGEVEEVVTHAKPQAASATERTSSGPVVRRTPRRRRVAVPGVGG